MDNMGGLVCSPLTVFDLAYIGCEGLRGDCYGHRNGRSKSHDENRRELCTASHGRGRSGFRPYHLGTSSACSAWAEAARGSSHTCCLGAAICTPRLCGLPGLRLQGKDATSAYRHPAQLEPRRIPEALGVAERSSPDRPGLLRAAVDSGKEAWSWSQSYG
jgi:hypothetical protein